MDSSYNRRDFLVRGAGSISALWLSSHWPALLAAAEHARASAAAAVSPKFEFFTPEEAKEIAAITSRIIPSGETPGAHEAGVVYFIDRGLATFASEEQKTYREGLPELQARVAEMFPSATKFSTLSADQQDEVLHSFDDVSQQGQRRRFHPRPGADNFFETARQHTIVGFLMDPGDGGSPDGTGWKVIGRERQHMFQPPFGDYDKDYPGWEQAAKEAEQK